MLIYDEKGCPRDVTSLWHEKVVLVVLVRQLEYRFFYRKQFSDLVASIPVLSEHDLQTVIVTTGSTEAAIKWKNQSGFSGDIFIDSSEDSLIFHMMLSTGDRKEELPGGVFVMGPGNMCTYGFRSLYPGHHPDFKSIPMYIKQNSNKKFQTLVSFGTVALGFSIVEACFVSTVAIAPAMLGMKIGTLTSGLIYLSFAFTTLRSPQIVSYMTPKPALVLGLCSFVCYIATTSLCNAYDVSTLLELLLCLFSLLAGAGGAVLWTAEGSYLSRSAEQYIVSNNHQKVAELVSRSFQNQDTAKHAKVNTRKTIIDNVKTATEDRKVKHAEALDVLSGLFNSIFQLSIPCAYLLSSLLLSMYGANVMYVSLLLAAAGATALSGSMPCPRRMRAHDNQAVPLETLNSIITMLREDDGRKRSSSCSSPTNGKNKLSGRPSRWETRHPEHPDTLSLVFLDKRILYLVPCNMAMGMMVAVMSYYVNAKVVKPLYGVSVIGYFVALQGVAAALFSPIFVFCASRLGRPLVMTVGTVAWSLECLIFLVLPSQYLTTPALVLAYILHGMGFSVWQGTATAVHASLYVSHPKWLDSAFANMKLWSGIGSAASYFVFPFISDGLSLLLTLIVIIISILLYKKSLTLDDIFDESQDEEDFFMKPRAVTDTDYDVSDYPAAFIGPFLPFDTTNSDDLEEETPLLSR